MIPDLKGKNVGVIGLGKSGLSAVKLLHKIGANVFISESTSEKKLRDIIKKLKCGYEIGKHSRELLKKDLLILSPGVNSNLKILTEAKKKKIPIWGELELGYRLLQSKNIIAITGTNGKTTTVSLLGEMCRRTQQKTLIAGNLGLPLCDFTPNQIEYKYTVLEVSSYQLESIQNFHPKVAVVLNLTSDHLKRHKTMQNYAKAKEQLFKNQTEHDFVVLNWDDPWCRKMEKQCRAKIVWISKAKLNVGVWWDKKSAKIVAVLNGGKMQFSPSQYLYGFHNIENSCAAIAAALCLGIPKKIIQEGLSHFKAVEHRLEMVCRILNVIYVNDSKATNVDSTIKAIESFKEPLWLILGGQDKGGSYSPLRSCLKHASVSNRVKGVFLIGEAAPIISKSLNGICETNHSRTLKNAVLQSSQRAISGDIVLLSPACASFDQFENFEDRGKQFKILVNRLIR